jgi:hypothetical protein
MSYLFTLPLRSHLLELIFLLLVVLLLALLTWFATPDNGFL